MEAAALRMFANARLVILDKIARLVILALQTRVIMADNVLPMVTLTNARALLHIPVKIANNKTLAHLIRKNFKISK